MAAGVHLRLFVRRSPSRRPRQSAAMDSAISLAGFRTVLRLEGEAR